MEVQILSRKLIKPASPTPDRLRSLKISSLDQLPAPVYVVTIFYYRDDGNDRGTTTANDERSKQLQKSLSETLTLFYPLAGRYVSDDQSIHCNDQGVEYVDARVSGKLSQLLDGDLDTKLLNRLFRYVNESSASPLAVFQLNMFECGGLALGSTISHRIMDGVSMSIFISAWTTACREGINKVSIPAFPFSSLFPVTSGEIISGIKPAAAPTNRANVVTKRVLFDAAAVLKLKEIAKTSLQRHPSKVQVVTALIWKTLIQIARAKHGCLRPSVLVQSVNLRGRTPTPVPENSCGNFYRHAIAKYMGDKAKIDLGELVLLLVEAAENSIMESMKAIDSDDLVSIIRKSFKEMHEELNNMDVDAYTVASWCRFPLYGADFGWGKPFWISRCHIHVERIINVMDSSDGVGIEAWLSLDEKDMDQFLQDTDILLFSKAAQQRDSMEETPV